MYTIGKLARKFGLSRSTLLYYDALGLLKPGCRSPKGYRCYTGAEVKRLQQICRFRQAGLALNEIARVLENPRNRISKALERRLDQINEEIGRLRTQQQFILGILRKARYHRKIGVMNKELWNSLLKASGFSEQDMLAWHCEFEAHDPDSHQRFLEFLCIPVDEIKAIRAWANRASRKPCPDA
jgi:DNA-binding transcriptional MerR regulator